MDFPIDDPRKMAEKIVADLNLKLDNEALAKLKTDLESLYTARLHELITGLADGKELDFENPEVFANQLREIPNIKKHIQYVGTSFYREMLESAHIVRVYKNSSQAT